MFAGTYLTYEVEYWTYGGSVGGYCSYSGFCCFINELHHEFLLRSSIRAIKLLFDTTTNFGVCFAFTQFDVFYGLFGSQPMPAMRAVARPRSCGDVWRADRPPQLGDNQSRKAAWLP